MKAAATTTLTGLSSGVYHGLTLPAATITSIFLVAVENPLPVSPNPPVPAEIDVIINGTTTYTGSTVRVSGDIGEITSVGVQHASHAFNVTYTAVT